MPSLNDLFNLVHDESDDTLRVKQIGAATLPSGAATEATLALIKAKTDNLDLATTALRDALRGVNDKTLSDLVILLAAGLPAGLVNGRLDVNVGNTPTITDGGSGKTLKTAKFSLTATGTVISLVASKRLKVYAVKLVVSAAISVKWRDGASTDLEDLQAYAANGGYTEAVNPPAFLFATTAGNRLDLVISGTGTAAGRVSYWDDDAA